MMLPVSRYKSIVRLVEIAQQALVEGQPRAEDRGEDGLLFQHLANGCAHRRLYFFFHIGQFPADLESGYFADTFQVAAEAHAVALDGDVPQLGYPVADQGMLLAQIDDHSDKAKYVWWNLAQRGEAA